MTQRNVTKLLAAGDKKVAAAKSNLKRVETLMDQMRAILKK